MLNEHDLKDWESTNGKLNEKSSPYYNSNCDDTESKEKEVIIRNAIETPDGTILESEHQHDYKSHTDAITGEVYVVDGGKDYLRRSLNKIPAKDLTVTTNDPFEVQREFFKWGSILQESANGYTVKQYRALKSLSTSHILAILRTQQQIIGTYVEKLMLMELAFRKELEVQIGKQFENTTDYSSKG